MQPDTTDVHVNTLLSRMSIGYQPGGFFAARAFPIVPVEKQTDIYLKYNKSHWARDLGAPGAAPTGSYAMLRAPGTRARVAEYSTDKTNTYRADNWAIGVEIPFEVEANADAVFNLQRDATTLAQSLLNIRLDRHAVADILGASYTALTVSNKWSDYSASTPIEDIRAGVEAIRRASLGMAANGGLRILMGALVFQRLADHPDLLERIKFGATAANPALVTENLLAQLFGVDSVYVARSVYTADEEGGTAEASVTYTDICSDDVLIYWAPANPGLLQPTAACLFNWYSAVGGRNSLFFVRSGEESRERYRWVEVHGYWDLVATDLTTGAVNTDCVD